MKYANDYGTIIRHAIENQIVPIDGLTSTWREIIPPLIRVRPLGNCGKFLPQLVDEGNRTLRVVACYEISDRLDIFDGFWP